CVGQAICKVQGGRMMALAVGEPSLGGQIDQFGVDGNDVGRDLVKPKIDLGQYVFAAPANQHHACLEHTSRRNQTDWIGDKCSFKPCCLGLTTQDRHNGRGVDHHQFGIPCSSYPMISSSVRLSSSGNR